MQSVKNVINAEMLTAAEWFPTDESASGLVGVVFLALLLH